MKCWVDKFWYDFSKEEILSDILLEFINHLETSPGLEKWAITLKKSYMKRKDAIGNKRIIFQNNPPKPIIPTQIGPDGLKILDIDSEEVARQMTLIEQKLFRKIKPWEYLGLGWIKNEKETKSPNILIMVNRFNEVSQWVATEICRVDNLKNRVKIMQKFIEIACKLRALNNFNGCVEIVSGLNCSSVSRLKNTINALPQKCVSILLELQEIVQRNKQYSRLRKEIHTCSPPCVPYLGLYLQDLIAVEESIQDTDQGLINCLKKKELGSIIREIDQYKELYCLESVSMIQEYLKKPFYYDEETNFRLSCYIEPKSVQRPEKPIELMTPDELQHTNNDHMEYELEFIEGYRFYEKDQPHNLVIEEKEDIEIIMAGTIEKLVERLTYEKLLSDSTYVDFFFATYRNFVTPRNLLDLLIMRNNLPKPNTCVQDIIEKYRKDKVIPIQLRVFNTLKIWIDKYITDFSMDKQLLDTIKGFIKQQVEASNTKYSQLEILLDKLLPLRKAQSRLFKGIMLTSESLNTPRPITEFDSLKIAEELARLTSTYYKKILPAEISYKQWMSPHAHMIAPNLLSFFGYLKKVSFNIDLQLRTFPDLLLQSITKWLEVLEYSQNLNNWAIVHVLVHTLDKLRITELNFVWNKVKYNHLEVLKECKQFISSKQNLDRIIEIGTQPLIPILELYLNEMAEIEEKMPSMLTETLINFHKHRLLADKIIPLINLQRTEYPGEQDESIKHWILREPAPHEFHVLCLKERFKVSRDLRDVEPKLNKILDIDSVYKLVKEPSEFRSHLSNLIQEIIQEESSNFMSEIKASIENLSTPLEKLKVFAAREFKGCEISCWKYEDTKGEIYGVPYHVQINTFLHSQGIYMCDIKEKIDIVDVLNLISIGKLFKKLYQDYQVLCVIIGCHSTQQALSLAQRANIRVILKSEYALSK